MKGKLNLDVEKIKTFFVDHTEKLVFGLLTLAFVYFAYGGLTYETLDTRPEDLAAAITQAQQHIDNSRPTDDGTSGENPLPSEGAQIAKVDPGPFLTSRLWRPNLSALGSKRGVPVVLPPDNLQVSSGYGALSTRQRGGQRNDGVNEGGAAEPVETSDYRGEMWTLVTGAVPLARQIDEYRDKFALAEFKQSGTADEKPEYIYWTVGRQQVGIDGQPAGEWETLHTGRAKAEAEKWGQAQGRPQEVVLGECIKPELAFDLPPILGHEWGDEIGHPDLPREKRAGEEPEPEAVVEEPTGDEPLDDLPTGSGQQPRREPRNAEPAQKDIDKLLFRFFDFDVAPGARYRYRVKVWVSNPNYEVEGRHLARSEMEVDGKTVSVSQTKWLISNWSRPSPPVAVPFPGRILAGTVVEPRGIDEQGMEAPIVYFDLDSGIEPMAVELVYRGQMVNREVEDVPIPKPGERLQVLEQRDFEFRTDSVVIDIGEGAGGPSDGRAVIMTPDLQLIVVEHDAEAAAVQDAVTELNAEESQPTFRGRDDDSDNPFDIRN